MFSFDFLDAINFWLGDERSVSSLHKDPYENIYCVIGGSKLFTLFHPCSFPFLNEQTYPRARWKRDNGKWKIEPINHETVPWISVNPQNRSESIKKFPPFQYAHQISVEVKAGETLFLPSFWYHEVCFVFFFFFCCLFFVYSLLFYYEVFFFHDFQNRLRKQEMHKQGERSRAQLTFGLI
jgi:hypothetical protein